MQLSIDDKAIPRVMQAIERRNELLRLWTKDLPRDFEEQLNEAHRIIAAAVTVAVRRDNQADGRISFGSATRGAHVTEELGRGQW